MFVSFAVHFVNAAGQGAEADVRFLDSVVRPVTRRARNHPFGQVAWQAWNDSSMPFPGISSPAGPFSGLKGKMTPCVAELCAV